MNTYARVISAGTGGKEVPGAAPGRDRLGRGMQPPQSEGCAHEDAAIRVGSAVYRVVTGRAPEPSRRRRLGVAAHYGFSAAMGVCYVLLANRHPFLRGACGGVFGAFVWALADEGMMPALGVSRGPRELTIDVHAYSLAGHVVFGATLESARRIGMND